MYDDNYIKKKRDEDQRKAQESIHSKEEENRLHEEEHIRLLLAQNTPKGKNHQQAARKRKRMKIWKYFRTEMHNCLKDTKAKEFQNLVFLHQPSKLIGNIVFSIVPSISV